MGIKCGFSSFYEKLTTRTFLFFFHRVIVAYKFKVDLDNVFWKSLVLRLFGQSGPKWVQNEIF